MVPDVREGTTMTYMGGKSLGVYEHLPSQLYPLARASANLAHGTVTAVGRTQPWSSRTALARGFKAFHKL